MGERRTISEINLNCSYLLLKDWKNKVDMVKDQMGGLITDPRIKKLENNLTSLIEDCESHFEEIENEKTTENETSNIKKDSSI